MIALTGATGFLGSALLAQLLARGHEVVAVKRSSSSVAKIQRCIGNPSLRLFDIDVEDPLRLFEQYPVNTIIHTATEYGRGATPLHGILDANLILPLRLAELGMQRGVRCFINTDSFFNKNGNSYSNLLNYSLSKKSLLIWLEKLSANIKIINVVLEHLYGPGDSPSKFVESVIRKVAVEQPPHIALTHGHQQRDFIFIDDVVEGFLCLLEYGQQQDFRFETFELGTGQATQIRDFVDSVRELSASPTELGFGDIPYHADEIMHSAADTSRLERLGWTPSVPLRDGIQRILREHGVL